MTSQSQAPNATDLPTRADDPRLQNWYHTIELGTGSFPRAPTTTAPIVDKYGSRRP